MHFFQTRQAVYHFFLLFLAALSSGLVWNKVNFSANHHASNDRYDAFAIHVTSTQFATTGKKKYQLISPRLSHEGVRNITRANQPRLYVYNQQQEAWLITADYALASSGAKQIQFINNVDISGSDTKNYKNTHLTTEKISYFPEKNMATTDLPVTIMQPGFAVRAIGAEANFNNGEINLLSKITGSYDPTIHA